MFELAIKYIFSRKLQSLLMLIGVAFGCGGYIVFTSIQTGFQNFLKERLIENNGHITIRSREDYITTDSLAGVFFQGKNIYWITEPSGKRSHDYLQSAWYWQKRLEKLPYVVANTRRIEATTTCSRGSFSRSIALRGIDPVNEPKVTNIAEDIIEGKLQMLSSGNNMVIVGVELLKFLGAKVNDTINIINPNGHVYPVKIVGIYSSGDRRNDESLVLGSITTVQNILESPGKITKIVVKTVDANKAALFAQELSHYSYDKVESWDQANINFLSMTKQQTLIRQITMFTFILVVSFGIYNVLNMLVYQKQREIAILRSIGYTSADTVILFLLQGALISIAGGVIGLIAGYAACSYIQTIKLPGRPMMVAWDLSIYIWGFMLVIISALFASFLPAKNAGRLSPIEIIRRTE
ncbi:MAG TPA: ABC transporter permease [Spirochaetota bacterium]|nr:ABC transporter permease [Spirochaetota bacterium]